MIKDENTAKLILDFDLQQTDPSLSYDIIERIGGFTNVLKVKRKADDVICALKLVEPKTAADRDTILNEVGIMLICK